MGIKGLLRWVMAGLLCGAVLGQSALVEAIQAMSESAGSRVATKPVPPTKTAASGRAGAETSERTSGQKSGQGDPASAETPTQEGARGFTIERYVVEGNTVLSTEKIDGILDKYK